MLLSVRFFVCSYIGFSARFSYRVINAGDFLSEAGHGPRTKRVNFTCDPSPDAEFLRPERYPKFRIQELLQRIFIYYCVSSYQPRIKCDNALRR